MSDDAAVTPYAVTIIFTDLRELRIPDTLRHQLSKDLQTLEVVSVQSVFIVPMRTVRYVAVDAAAFTAPAKPALRSRRKRPKPQPPSMTP
jgi:hypothetical protein